MKPRPGIRTLALLALLAGALLLSRWTAQAAVDLSDFTVTPGDGQVFLDWETATEFAFAGFSVRRSLSDDGDYGNWNLALLDDADTALVEALDFIAGRDDFGAEYHFLDLDVQNGTQYCYVLEAINDDNSNEFFPQDGAECVTPGQTPTETASPTASISPTSGTPAFTPTPSRTPLPTSTRAPSATPSPTLTASPTLSATATLTPTATTTPWPTFLPTWTSTPTPTPTRTLTPTATNTPGSLLESTRMPGTPPSGLAGLLERNEWTLNEFILGLTVLFALVGGALLTGLYFLAVRMGEEREQPQNE